MIGTFLTAFRNAKAVLVRDSKQKLWERNDLANPAQRHKYEIREHEIKNGDKVDIVLELWHKVDSEHIRLQASVESGVVEDSSEETMKDLLNG